VKAQRPALDVERVATGEYWLAGRGLELGLVDQLGTSDEYLLARSQEAEVYQVRYQPEPTWRSRLGAVGAEVVERLAMTLARRLQGLALR